MKEYLDCKNCKLTYDSAEHRQCPNCDSIFTKISTKPQPETLGKNSPNSQTSNVAKNSNDNVAASKYDLIVEAADRTTHAVRAIAIFFFTFLISSAIGGVLIAIAMVVQAAGENAGILFFAGYVALLAGYVLAMVSGAQELRHSRNY